MTRKDKVVIPNSKDKITSKYVKNKLTQTYKDLIKSIQDDTITFKDIEVVVTKTLQELSIICSKDLIDMMKTVRTEKAKQLERKMLPQEIAFGMLYCHGTKMGNGVRCYEQAFNHPIINKIDFQACASRSRSLLRQSKIMLYITELMSTYVLNAVVVDQQLKFIIMQNSDLGVKLGGIREFNKLNNRIQDKMMVEIWHQKETEAHTDAKNIVEQYRKQLDSGDVTEADMAEVEKFAGRVVDSVKDGG